MKEPSPKTSGLSSWYKTRQQKKKEKEEQERNPESFELKIITFAVTAVAMALGMSFLPLFPQPLPILLAVLVAFVTFKNPRFGMPIGGAVIGLGLIYHLSGRFTFFLSLETTYSRGSNRCLDDFVYRFAHSFSSLQECSCH